MSKYTVGVDIGGTNIKLGLVSPSCKIISKTSFETKSCSSSKKALINALADAILKLLSKNNLTKKNVKGIGIGLPGLIDPKKGVVKRLTNIPGWKNVPLVKLLKARLHLPVYIDNDVNLITLAQWKYGAGRGCKDLLCITLGTGVGGGIVFNNKIYRGPGFVAGEIGHIPLKENGADCPCGGKGCLERYLGNKILVQKLRTIFKNPTMRIEDSNKLATKGNRRAKQFWDDTGRILGQGLTGIVNVLNPKRIVIGGGVANNYKFFSPMLKKTLKKNCMKVQGAMVSITRAKFGSKAGIIGAHVLVNEGY